MAIIMNADWYHSVGYEKSDSEAFMQSMQVPQRSESWATATTSVAECPI